jgi:hypothetical protein
MVGTETRKRNSETEQLLVVQECNNGIWIYCATIYMAVTVHDLMNLDATVEQNNYPFRLMCSALKEI